MLQGFCLSSAGPQDWRCPLWGSNPSLVRKDLNICDIFSCLANTIPRVWILTASRHLLPAMKRFPLYILSCRTAILLVLLFSDRVVQCVVVILVCLWEEMSLRSSYPHRLDPLQDSIERCFNYDKNFGLLFYMQL